MNINEINLVNKLLEELWPLHRSITGEGINKSLDILAKHIPIKKIKFPSGKKVYDWTIPKEWVVNKAYVITQTVRILDIKKNNLHLINYSDRFIGEVSKEDL